MDVDIALYTLDQFVSGESVNFDQARQALGLVSHYVNFLEVYASPDAVSISRNGVGLVAGLRTQPGDFQAVVTLGGADYAVSAYNHALGGIALRLAERELARKLGLRVIEGAPDLRPLSSVISAASAQPQRKTNQKRS